MKKYVSHKQVEAGLIECLVLYDGEEQARATLSGGGQVLVSREFWRRIHADWATRLTSGASFCGAYYLVRYSDGYLSFSPAKAFEEGYTELGEEVAAAGDFQAAGCTFHEGIQIASRPAGFTPHNPQVIPTDPAEVLLNDVRAAFSLLTAPKQWESRQASATDSREIDRLCAGGWEPYAAYATPRGAEIVLLKRPLRAE